MGKLFYRYRPINIALNKTIIDEIKNQEIFFASIKENNDPTDGKHILYFEGDEIVWKCFVRNCFYGLYKVFINVAIFGNDKEISEEIFNSIVFPYDRNCDMDNDFLKIYDKFFENNNVREIMGYIFKEEKFSFNETKFLILEMKKFFLYYTKKLILEKRIQNLADISDRKIFEKIIFNHNELSVVTQLKLFEIEDVKKRQNLMSKLMIFNEELLSNQLNLLMKSNDLVQETYKKNIIIANVEYIKLYFKNLYNLNFQEYYLSCFSGEPYIELLWSHYADKHQGVCLIFESDDDLGIIFENRIPEKLLLKPINYLDENVKVNFFDYLGKYNEYNLRKIWFEYNGQESVVLKNFDKKEFHTKYWSLYDIKTLYKKEIWSYENEFRLVESRNLYGKLEINERILKYKKEHLVGIIFGSEIETFIKYKIIDNLREKLTKDEFNKFLFKQARYNMEDNTLEIDKINLNI